MDKEPPGPLAPGTQQGPDRPSGLSQAPDFYVEMKWEFTSWGESGLLSIQGLGEGLWERTSVTSVPSAVPLVSKMCPSDVYRVWKRGESLRVDTSLLGFEHMTWQRGRRSFIFKGQGELGGGSLWLPSLSWGLQSDAVLSVHSPDVETRLGWRGPRARPHPLSSRGLRAARWPPTCCPGPSTDLPASCTPTGWQRREPW